MKMPLPDNFLFSQGNLQDYIECRRRFLLRHINKIAWPAIKSEPVIEQEKAMFRGQRFHRLINGYFLGIPARRLTEMAEDSDTLDWWRHFLDFITGHPEIQASIKKPEVAYQINILEHRLIARYDLLVITPKKLFIFDWKTSRKRPKRNNLAARLQTRIYPFLLSELKAVNLEPEQVSMVYWFSNFPDNSERFDYDRGLFQQDRTYLGNLVTQITLLGEEDYSLTEGLESCRYCEYRSLCNRGVEAGEMNDEQGEIVDEVETRYPTQFDFATIPEIEL
jgi:CRISPR/Cas system-associated exonuclease Cas4 (RecB family)